MLSEEDQAEDTVNMHRKFREVWTCNLFRYASGHTYRQTDRQTDI